eukprot:scaffold55937_cov64-Cyclotella_meneghiniana.AAC.1
MADISNPAKNDPMFKLWTDRCLDEFFEQGDKERNMGVPISPNCDRNIVKRPDSQIGFIKFVVKPAYEVLGDILPAVKESILPIIDNNLQYWEEQKQTEQNGNNALEIRSTASMMHFTRPYPKTSYYAKGVPRKENEEEEEEAGAPEQPVDLAASGKDFGPDQGLLIV